MNKLRFSKYAIQSQIDENKALFFNTIDRSIVELESNFVELINSNVLRDDNDLETKESIEQLKQMGFLVEENHDDDASGYQWYKDVRNKKDLIDLTILTTYSCNLACPYCVENGVKNRIFLKPDTSASIVKWIESLILKDHPKELRITFYGGEPLLNKKELYNICDEINYLATKYNLSKNLRMISNGVLLDQNTVHALKEHGINWVKITLDGFGDDHDAKRPTLGGKGTFDKIISNVLYAANHLKVTIGTNFNHENYDSVTTLIDYLHSLGLHEKLESFYAKPILSTIGDKIASAISQQCTICKMSETDCGNIVSLTKYAMEKGFNVKDRMALGPCQALMYHSYVIDPLGNIFKCPGFVGRYEFKIGHVKDGDINEEKSYRNLDLNLKCKSCHYMPICASGCRHSAYMETGDDKAESCEMKYFETTLKPFMHAIAT